MFFSMVAEQWKSTGSCNVNDGEGLLAAQLSAGYPQYFHVDAFSLNFGGYL